MAPRVAEDDLEECPPVVPSIPPHNSGEEALAEAEEEQRKEEEFEEREFQPFLVEEDVDTEVEVSNPHKLNFDGKDGESAAPVSSANFEQGQSSNGSSANYADDEESDEVIIETVISYWLTHKRHRPQPLSKLPDCASTATGISGSNQFFSHSRRHLQTSHLFRMLQSRARLVASTSLALTTMRAW